jgi:uncharacterized membrane protein
MKAPTKNKPKSQAVTPAAQQRESKPPAKKASRDGFINVNIDRKRDALNAVMLSGLAVSNSARETYKELRNGTINGSEAKELSNALGRANGADANVVKAVMTEMVLDKFEVTYATQQAKALGNGEG